MSKKLLFIVFVLQIILLVIMSREAIAIDDYVTKKLAWGNPEKAASISDYGVTALMVSPYVLILNEKENRVKKAASVATIQFFNHALTGYVKRSVGRTRPNRENNKSFWSGHSANSAASAAIVCKLDKRYCLPAISMALSVGYFRIAAQKHWFTDVLSGLTVGYANGKYMPKLIINF